jgi:hypothetical protein
MTDLASGRFDRLLPGQMVSQYDMSPDQDRVVAVVVEDDGRSRLWVAWLDHREPPRRLGIEAVSARFGPRGMVVFNALQGSVFELFRTDVDETTPRRLSSEPAGNILGQVSPDGAWISDKRMNEVRAVSTTDGNAVLILNNSNARMRWSPDGSRALLQIQSGPGPIAFGFGRTYALPLEAGSMLPRTPEGGFKSESELATWPGVEVLPYGDLAFGPTPGNYVFSKITVTRNLYRIPLR